MNYIRPNQKDGNMDRRDFETNAAKNYSMPSEGDFAHTEAVKGKIRCISTLLEPGSSVPIGLVLLIDVDFLNPPIDCRYTKKEAWDSLIGTMIAARNHMWPEE
jgi:hypothetical protein